MRRLRPLLAIVLLALALAVPRSVAAQATPSASPAAPTTTALLVSAIRPPLRVTASDGRVHLEYDLMLINVFTAPVTLTSVDVLTPDGHVLLHLAGDSLRAMTQPLLGQTPTDAVPKSGAVATMLDVVVPPDQVPARLTHHISYVLSQNAPNAPIVGSLEIAGPELSVDPFAPVVIAPPLRGAGWLNGSGCCDPSPHRLARLAVDGTRLAKPETFAIDWLQLKGDRLIRGDGTRNEDYFGFGAEVLAVADGTVVAARDGIPDILPKQPPTTLREPLDYGGNLVSIELRPGVYADYAHFQPGSLRVHVGERVTTGQVLGLLGNSGNTTAPHLHFELADGPQIVSANSLPFEINAWTLEAKANLNSEATAVQLSGSPRAQTDTLPLDGDVSSFP